jgi:hypothetical protein
MAWRERGRDGARSRGVSAAATIRREVAVVVVVVVDAEREREAKKNRRK